MRQHHVFSNGNGGMRAVKIGWSWPGFFFGFIWALAKELWLLGLALLALHLIFGAFMAFVPASEKTMEGVDLLLSALTSFAFLFYGNRLVEWDLRRRGWRYIGTFTAANRDAAIALASEKMDDRGEDPAQEAHASGSEC